MNTCNRAWLKWIQILDRSLSLTPDCREKITRSAGRMEPAVVLPLKDYAKNFIHSLSKALMVRIMPSPWVTLDPCIA